jgi:hypothetical protein
VTHSDIYHALREFQIPYMTEARMHAAVAEILTRRGWPFTQECRLSDTDRIDFLAGDVGIECKIDGGPTEVLMQCQRYTEHERVGSLILVTSRASHRFEADFLGGKSFSVLWVAGQL